MASNERSERSERDMSERVAWLAKQRRDWQDWQAAHPRYCVTCRGAGGHETPDSYDEPGEVTACPDCVAAGYCPWCSAPIIGSELDGIAYAVCNDDGCEWELGEYPH